VTIEHGVPAPNATFPFTVTCMASTAYIAASANRFSSVSDISATSLVAFGSGRFVALWDSSVRLSKGTPSCNHHRPCLGSAWTRGAPDPSWS
jgi:hypothetical protein